MTNHDLSNPYVNGQPLSIMLAATVSELVVNAAGVASVGLLTIGQTKVVPVTIRPTMPDTNYSVAAVPVGSATLLGQIEVTGAVVLDTSTVNVTVHSTALISVSTGVVLVNAVKG